ncbi:MAG: hypothetical protein Q8Q35_02750 [Nanoarchaeota archaeon]|nr:hypothetical protein [Nanoarchaeota archaeon]
MKKGLLLLILVLMLSLVSAVDNVSLNESAEDVYVEEDVLVLELNDSSEDVIIDEVIVEDLPVENFTVDVVDDVKESSSYLIWIIIGIVIIGLVLYIIRKIMIPLIILGLIILGIIFYFLSKLF